MKKPLQRDLKTMSKHKSLLFSLAISQQSPQSHLSPSRCPSFSAQSILLPLLGPFPHTWHRQQARVRKHLDLRTVPQSPSTAQLCQCKFTRHQPRKTNQPPAIGLT